MAVATLRGMPSLRTLDDAAKQAKVSRRLLQVWLSEGRLKRWAIPGDHRRYVDLDEVKKLMQPRVVPPKPKQ
jgi:predicted site-specific integrase-resolvase